MKRSKVLVHAAILFGVHLGAPQVLLPETLLSKPSQVMKIYFLFVFFLYAGM